MYKQVIFCPSCNSDVLECSHLNPHKILNVMIYIKSSYSNLDATTSINYLEFFSLRTFISWLQANTWNIENDKLKFQQITKETYNVNTETVEVEPTQQ